MLLKDVQPKLNLVLVRFDYKVKGVLLAGVNFDIKNIKDAKLEVIKKGPDVTDAITVGCTPIINPNAYNFYPLDFEDNDKSLDKVKESYMEAAKAANKLGSKVVLPASQKDVANRTAEGFQLYDVTMFALVGEGEILAADK